jgi:hypothetical protein
MGADQDESRPSAGHVDTTSFSNAVRLTGREWLLVGLFAALLPLLPTLWKQREPLQLDTDYRIPHQLGNDYWLYERVARELAERCDILLVGDSVIWGEYVTSHETLSHYLNVEARQPICANLGLDGAHPLALEGLLGHYAGSLQNKKVVVQWNALWMSSPRVDLQDERQTDFNHPRLVAQFTPRIPAYKEEMSTRIGVVVEQHLELSSWVNHLQQAYYDQRDIPGWTLQHPHENPLAPLANDLPGQDDQLPKEPRPWYASGFKAQDYPWVDPENSLQWQAFQRVVRLLKRRGNQVFVLVGPFNEHMLEPASLEKYRKIRAAAVAWMVAEQIPHAVPSVLARDQYGDASHPLAAGYEALAKQLWREPFFDRGSLMTWAKQTRPWRASALVSRY